MSRIRDAAKNSFQFINKRIGMGEKIDTLTKFTWMMMGIPSKEDYERINSLIAASRARADSIHQGLMNLGTLLLSLETKLVSRPASMKIRKPDQTRELIALKKAKGASSPIKFAPKEGGKIPISPLLKKSERLKSASSMLKIDLRRKK